MRSVAMTIAAGILLASRFAFAWERQNHLTASTGAGLSSAPDVLGNGGAVWLSLTRSILDDGGVGPAVGMLGTKTPFLGTALHLDARLRDAAWFVPIEVKTGYLISDGINVLLHIQAGPSIDTTIWGSIGIAAGYGHILGHSVHLFTLSLRGSFIWGF